MTRISPMVAILLALGCQGSDSAPAAAEPDEGEPAARAEDADKEVLIASRPDGADVLLDGAKVGVTPMKMLLRGKTNVLLDKQGYVQQALLITPDSEPNIVVELVPSEEESRGDAGAEQGGEQAVADEEEEEEEEEPDESGSGSRKRGVAGAKSGGSDKEKQGEKSDPEKESAASEGEGEGDEAAAAAGDESGSGQDKKSSAKSKVYQNMDQLKRDLRDGKISREEYRKWQAKLRAARFRELAELKKRYEAEEISRDDFRRMAAEIKSRYEGH